jgi:hypothetical protein
VIAKLKRTKTDFCGLSPFQSERTNGPDRTFADYGPKGAKGRQGRIHRPGTDRGYGYCTPFRGTVRSGPVGPPGELEEVRTGRRVDVFF